MKKQTQAIHTHFQDRDPYGALSMPVYHTAAYEFENTDEMIESFCGRSALPDYSRVTNPTVTFFENKVRQLTGARDVVAFASGMAAITNTFLALGASGKNVVTSKHVFANTYALMTTTLKRFGLEGRYVDLTNLDEVKTAINANTCCVYLEIMTNPQLEVADLQALSHMAHELGIPLVADSTAIPFTHLDLKSLGVDIEVVSSTKYLSGGATSVGGLIIDYGYVAGLDRQLRQELLLNVGAYMTPHVAYMQTIGLENLDARYRLQAQNAQEVAEKLTQIEKIKRVNYVGLKDNPYYAIARRQFGPTSGAMLTFDLESQAACFRFLNQLRLVRRATNLFDNKSLAIHPYSTIFGGFSDEVKQSMDVLDTTIRLSIGLEAVEDIMADIIQALA